ncbi:hypothetical protein DPM19_20910 [Actinomadura craniellae]|uniref:Uncharacterized protein n=1 Tax=Actinomadura craniellae TaxID=2231787 RepID=A0A365H344_9ACTN|nr:hypothetical protein [Actinomadura craniellae]RAY13511.1 hypothetical protein DPM19_20910 [Actinomadura craniellae]
MTPKRNDRVAQPPVGEEWEIRFGTNDAAKGWDELCQQVPTNTRAAWDQMRVNPRPAEDIRHTRLRGEMGVKMRGGVAMELWQIEVTSGGRIFYSIDDKAHTVWVELATMSHPKKTEKKRH